MIPKSKPITKQDIIDELAQLQIAGKTLIVHSSLSSVGYVVGGAVGVIQALQSALEETGTLVMPGFTSNLAKPKEWLEEEISAEWMKIIEDNIPAFQKDLTPTYQMGVIPETFRKLENTKRSNHPWSSWLANGTQADFITQDAPLDFPNGDQSPLGRLYDLDACVLFLGTSYYTCSCLHLAEMRNKFAEKKRRKRPFRVLRNGKPEWEDYDDIYLYDKDFEEIGAEFEKQAGKVRLIKIGSASSRIFKMKDMVDFAVNWMNDNRSLGG